MDKHLDNCSAVVFAAGKGTRMGGETSKVLLKVGGKPMIFYTLTKLNSLKIAHIQVVVGYKADEVKSQVGKDFNVEFVYQPEQKGTANALEIALEHINTDVENIIVVNGDDSALYSEKTLRDLIETQTKNQAVITALVVKVDDSVELGRIIRNRNGGFEKNLELEDYQKSGLKSNLVNCGAEVFNQAWLRKNINKIKPNKYSGEYYITDLFNLAKDQGDLINLVELEDPNEWVGVNTPEDLKRANQLMEGGLNG